MKIAFSGTSGSGKTTLVRFLEQESKLPHISASAGDLLTVTDKEILGREPFNYKGDGHLSVIKHSAINPRYAYENQYRLLHRRTQLLHGTHPLFPGVVDFITDRSPIDNIVYFMMQTAYHAEVTDALAEEFVNVAVRAAEELDHIIYVKAVQPGEVENNGSRINKRLYQLSVDQVFNYWFEFVKDRLKNSKTQFHVIDFWDLDRRKAFLKDLFKRGTFINY